MLNWDQTGAVDEQRMMRLSLDVDTSVGVYFFVSMAPILYYCLPQPSYINNDPSYINNDYCHHTQDPF